MIDLTSMAESYGYQVRYRLWRVRERWCCDVLVLDPAGVQAAHQIKRAGTPLHLTEWTSQAALEELRRVHKARWREG